MTRPAPREWSGFTHLLPYARNNSPVGIKHAARHAPHRIDLDLQVTRDRVGINTHWPHPRTEGFARGGIVPMRPFRRLTWRKVSQLRSRGGHRIDPILTQMHRAATAGVKAVELDAKDARRLEDRDWWLPIAEQARTLEQAYGMTTIVKTASTLGGRRRAGRRLRAAHKAGLPTMLLTRGWGLMDRRFGPYIDYVRGAPIRWVGKR